MNEHSVMVVDDDFEIREVLLEILEDQGYRAQGAAHGGEALEKLRASPSKPCLILLDLMMPRMDGWTFRAEQLRSPELASIPVVLVSAAGALADNARQLGAAGCMQKPIDLEELLRVLHQHCPQDGSCQ